MIAGPMFISIGDLDGLKLFLEHNPTISPDAILVDDKKEFSLYQQAGFQSFGQQSWGKIKEVSYRIPDLGLLDWWNYLTSIPTLGPFTPDLKFGQLPAGGMVNGGTMVVRGDDILYRWNDRMPGDHPDIEEVMKAARAGSKD